MAELVIQTPEELRIVHDSIAETADLMISGGIQVEVFSRLREVAEECAAQERNMVENLNSQGVVIPTDLLGSFCGILMMNEPLYISLAEKNPGGYDQRTLYLFQGLLSRTMDLHLGTENEFEK